MDSGDGSLNYTCKILQNVYPEPKVTHRLFVSRGPPTVFPYPKNEVDVILGGSETIGCTTNLKPKPRIIFTRNVMIILFFINFL